MIGIGIITHNDVVSKNDTTEDIFDILMHLITTIDMFTTEPYILIIVDNDSFDHRFKYLNVILKNKFPHINSVFIRHAENDLTAAWNMIVDICINTYMCDGVILLNQDILITKYWMPFIKAVQYQRQDVIAPMSNGACYQLLQMIEDHQFTPQDTILLTHTVQGFCFGASRHCFTSNMYNSKYFFDPEISWDYNEEEFQRRNNEKNGQSLILKNSFVIHLDQCSWLQAGLRSKKQLKQKYTGDERDRVLDKFNYHSYYI
jgi:hypothetical protein